MPNYLVELDVREKVFVDLGCGYGRILLWLMRQQDPSVAIGVDISDVMLDRCRDLATALGLAPVLIRAELHNLPLDDEVADLVNSTAVLLHTDKSYARDVLAETRRILKPGGLAYFGDTFFNPRSALGAQTWIATQLLRRRRQPTWVRQYTRSEVMRLAASVGFARVEVRPRNFAVLPKNLGPWPVPRRSQIVSLNARLSRSWEREPPFLLPVDLLAQNFDLLCWR
jgi:ubiquinone/menaquinone biosynthesis C-methylase UbiE